MTTNNNLGTLAYSDGTAADGTIAMPDNNTNPDNLAEFFSEWPSVLNDYDLVMTKSCYPNSHIRDEVQLDKIKDSYTSIIESFNNHNKQLLIMTLPPLRPLLTNKTEAQLSSELADWLVSRGGDKIQVFDLHHLLSEKEGRYKGMLRRGYRRLLPFDNHPNRKAHRVIAPMMVETIKGG